MKSTFLEKEQWNSKKLTARHVFLLIRAKPKPLQHLIPFLLKIEMSRFPAQCPVTFQYPCLGPTADLAQLFCNFKLRVINGAAG